MTECLSQNDLLLQKLMIFYNKDDNLNKMLRIINGQSKISLRIVDWFSTNYAKKNFTVYETKNNKRFKVYQDYKLRLKAYSKKRFDPFVVGIGLKYHTRQRTKMIPNLSILLRQQLVN